MLKKRGSQFFELCEYERFKSFWLVYVQRAMEHNNSVELEIATMLG